jgi:hypothetical protein
MDVREKLVELANDVLRYLPWGEIQKDTAEQIADRMIDHGVTVQEWISVKEHPKKDGKYLVHKDLYGTSYISTIRFAKDGEKVCAYDLKGQKNVWYDYDSETGYFPVKSVTHWQHLPQPPKGE